MHYRNGREAREGDPVITADNGVPTAGTIHSLKAGSTSCNARLAIPTPGGIENRYVTIGECHHAEDALAAVEPNDQLTPLTAPTE